MKKLIAITFCFPILLQVSAQKFESQLEKARSGDSEAMIILARFYQFGEGVEMNDDSSNKWIQRAAELKNPDGMFMQGSYLVTKIYSKSEFAKGIQWLERAADTNQVMAMMKLYEIYTTKNTGTESDKYYSMPKAMKYLIKADSLGNTTATLLCAENFLIGKGVPQSDSIAIFYFRKSAEVQGIARGEIRLGELYLSGKITGKLEPFIARDWFVKAYQHKHATLDDRGMADVGIHKVDQMMKQTQNLMMQSAFFFPVGTFHYRLQKSE